MTITPKVNFLRLMRDVANEAKAPAITYGVQIAGGCLQRIAERACVIGDDAILKELATLDLVTIKETESLIVTSLKSGINSPVMP